MNDVTTVKELLAKANSAREDAHILLKEAYETETRAIELCTHPATENDSEYLQGSYFEKAQVRRVTKCAICGKILSEELDTLDFYG